MDYQDVSSTPQKLAPVYIFQPFRASRKTHITTCSIAIRYHDVSQINNFRVYLQYAKRAMLTTPFIQHRIAGTDIQVDVVVQWLSTGNHHLSSSILDLFHGHGFMRYVLHTSM